MGSSRIIAVGAALALAAPLAAQAAPPAAKAQRQGQKPFRLQPPAGKEPPARKVPPPQPAREPGERAARRGNHTWETELPERELGGHYFIPNLAFNSPFITTLVGSATAVSTADFDFDGGLTLPFFGLAQWFDAQLGIADRVAVRAAVRGDALAPREEDAALIIALVGSYAFGGGVTVKALEEERLQLSGSFDYSHSTGALVTPGILLDDIVRNLAERGELVVNDELLFTETGSDSFAFGGQGALALHETIGLLADASWIFQSEDGEQDAFLRLGAGLSLNLASLGVPVGANVSYVRALPVNAANDTETDQLVGAGLYYTGRRYLDVGIEGQGQFLEIDDGDVEYELTTLGAAFIMRAYF